MTNAEKFEIALIPVVGVIVWLMTAQSSNNIGSGMLLLYASVLLLFQGLIRDLWLLAQQKKTVIESLQKEARCMCVESTIGITGVIIGIIALGSGFDQAVSMNQWIWSALVIAVMTVGFLIKDYVIEWSPFRLRRDKYHMNIVFTWKGKSSD